MGNTNTATAVHQRTRSSRRANRPSNQSPSDFIKMLMECQRDALSRGQLTREIYPYAHSPLELINLRVMYARALYLRRPDVNPKRVKPCDKAALWLLEEFSAEAMAHDSNGTIPTDAVLFEGATERLYKRLNIEGCSPEQLPKEVRHGMAMIRDDLANAGRKSRGIRGTLDKASLKDPQLIQAQQAS